MKLPLNKYKSKIIRLIYLVFEEFKMNKPIVLMIVILLIIGAIAVNKILSTPDTVNPQISQQGTVNPTTNNTSPPPTNNNNSPNIPPKTNVMQK